MKPFRSYQYAMSKKDFIWIFNSTSLKAGLDGPFSFEYHVSKTKMLTDASGLIDARIWLVVKVKGKYFLYAFLTPNFIEQYVEGSYKGDFLLQTNPYNSVRLLPRIESRETWALTNLQNGEEGLRRCSNEERTMFLRKLSNNYRLSFSLPSRSILSSIPKTDFMDIGRAIPEQIKLVLRTLAFGDIARSKSFPTSVSAFGGIALLLLQKSIKNINSPESIELMASLDPFVPDESAEPKSPKDNLKTATCIPPLVDTCLEEIDPDKISPRIFIARSENCSLGWLNKTGEAEKNHEEIIKDIVVYLNSVNLKSYKSRSFDLFTENADSKCLWEIKSTNEANTVEQGEKGIVQLLRYSAALSDAAVKNVRFLLLLQINAQYGVFSYLSRMAEMAGVELWLYDKNRDWPNRILNINEEIISWD